MTDKPAKSAKEVTEELLMATKELLEKVLATQTPPEVSSFTDTEARKQMRNSLRLVEALIVVFPQLEEAHESLRSMIMELVGVIAGAISEGGEGVNTLIGSFMAYKTFKPMMPQLMEQIKNARASGDECPCDECRKARAKQLGRVEGPSTKQ